MSMKTFETALRKLTYTDYEWARDADGKEIIKCDQMVKVERSIAPSIIKVDGKLMVTSESGQDLIDYYGEYRGGCPYVHPMIEDLTHKHGVYFEWEHPGAICFTQ